MPPLRIERFSPEKHDALVELLTQLLHRAYAPLAAAGMRYLATHQAPSVTRERLLEGEGFLAFLGEDLAGTISVHAEEEDSTCGYYRRAGVYSFRQYAVDPALQGRGFGDDLLAFAEERAKKRGATELALDTSERASGLIALYRRRGYRIVDHVQWDGVNYRSVIMAKEL